MGLIDSIWGIVATAMVVGALGFLVETTSCLGHKALDAHQSNPIVSLPELNKMLFAPEKRGKATHGERPGAKATNR